jgi:dihydrofolate synthase/folylpolyglutamate synthase
MGAALQLAGYRPGLFTSPHLTCFTERIAVGDRPSTVGELSVLVKSVRDTGVELTYFEFATVLAVLYFATQRVDLAVLEVGMGGEWDATNALDPVLSVITTVDLDHQNWLGGTIEDIAREKSGIMRAGRPVIVGPVSREAKQVFIEQAKAGGARLILYGSNFRYTVNNDCASLHFQGRKWDIEKVIPGMKGMFQLENAACALAALEILEDNGFKVGQDAAAAGIRSARWRGRLQTVDGHPRMIIDAAHNPAAVRALITSLGTAVNVVWLFSALSDKDIEGMAAEMMKLSKRFVLVPLPHPRGSSVRDLVLRMPEDADITETYGVSQGIAAAAQMAGEDGSVVVAGSVVLAGKVLTEIGETG